MEDITDYQASIMRHLAMKSEPAHEALSAQSLDKRVVHAYCALQAGGKLEAIEFNAKPLGAQEVELKVLYCGVCHSDLDVWRNRFNTSNFPVCLGHEIVGAVSRVGELVKHLAIGQRVGVGWFRGACGNCEFCMSGRDQLCSEAEATTGSDAGVGGFSDYIRVAAAAAIPIPAEIPSEVAGPLFCAGATVFAPFVTFRIPSTARVGLVGLGGLGHLFVKFAAAWGCEVTVFSHSDKAAEATRLGARRFCRLTEENAGALAQHRDSLDFLLVTAPVPNDWPALIRCLRPDGTLCFQGFVPGPIRVAPSELILRRLRIVGHPTGGRGDIIKMLDFCARHRVFPEVEQFSVHEAAAALRRLEEGGLRYRAVLRVGDAFDRAELADPALLEDRAPQPQ